jgi:hypothetical protein
MVPIVPVLPVVPLPPDDADAGAEEAAKAPAPIESPLPSAPPTIESALPDDLLTAPGNRENPAAVSEPAAPAESPLEAASVEPAAFKDVLQSVARDPQQSRHPLEAIRPDGKFVELRRSAPAEGATEPAPAASAVAPTPVAGQPDAMSAAPVDLSPASPSPEALPQRPDAAPPAVVHPLPPHVREAMRTVEVQTEPTPPPVAAAKVIDDDDAPPARLAFAAKLVVVPDPVSPEATPSPMAKADPKSVPAGKTSEPPPDDDSAPPPSLKVEAADPPRDRKVPATIQPRERKANAEEPPEPVHEVSREARAVTPDTPPETAAPAARPAAEPGRAPSAARTVTPHEVVQPAAAPTPARDIRIDLSGGERRVEVRLMERGGEVHVAVRTPDTQLAGQLRDNLPSLTARLEQTGIRTEAWHPGEAAAERRTEAAQSPRGESGDTRERSHSQGREQNDGNPRRSRETDTPANRKGKGISFSWFMPSET